MQKVQLNQTAVEFSSQRSNMHIIHYFSHCP